MKKYFLWLLLLLLPVAVLADESLVALEHAPVNLHDLDSIKRGAKTFSTICMSCHTLVYLRYNKLAQSAGIVYEKMPLNFKLPDGTHPPDLSLEADVRGVDWIYTYLHSFYTDSTRPTGFNNLLVPNTMMPDMIAAYRGKQILSADKALSQTLNHTWQWYDLLTLQQQGTVTPQEFDAMIVDVVNFLAYASEPYYLEQTRIGWWVIAFLSVFFVLAYLLKREYWKDIKR